MQQPTARGGLRSEINVTPLVDVCLVLLIIFMVVTPLLRRELPILLPETKGPGPSPAGQPLTEELRRLRAADPDRPVLVQGDRRLRYEQLSKLLESLDDAGFQRIGLIMVRGSQAQLPG